METPIQRHSPQHFTQQLPPPSSGSESSGYFTPPADHHLKEEIEESFEENNNLQEPNFQVIDSETSELQDVVSEFFFQEGLLLLLFFDLETIISKFS